MARVGDARLTLARLNEALDRGPPRQQHAKDGPAHASALAPGTRRQTGPKRPGPVTTDDRPLASVWRSALWRWPWLLHLARPPALEAGPGAGGWGDLFPRPSPRYKFLVHPPKPSSPFLFSIDRTAAMCVWPALAFDPRQTNREQTPRRRPCPWCIYSYPRTVWDLLQSQRSLILALVVPVPSPTPLASAVGQDKVTTTSSPPLPPLNHITSWHIRSFDGPLRGDHMVAKVKMEPRSSPSTLPRVISLRVAISQSSGPEECCVKMMRDMPPCRPITI